MDSSTVEFLYRQAASSNEARTIAVAFASLPIFLILIAAIVAPMKRAFAQGWFLFETAVGAGLAIGINAVLHFVYFRPRPFSATGIAPLIGHFPDASFFSDHLAVAGALTVYVFRLDRRLGIAAIALSIVMALGRVAVAVHYPSDVLFGFLVGSISSVFVWSVARKFWH